MKPINIVTGRKGLGANSSCKGNKENRSGSKKSLHVVLYWNMLSAGLGNIHPIPQKSVTVVKQLTFIYCDHTNVT